MYSVGVVVEQFRGARMKINGYVFDLMSGFVFVFLCASIVVGQFRRACIKIRGADVIGTPSVHL